MHKIESARPLARTLLILGILSACNRQAAPPKPTVKPSRVESGRVILAPSAETRLGINLAPVERHDAPERRLYPAEVQPMPGRSALLTAPQSGTVVAIAADAPLTIGAKVRAGQALLALAPLFVVGERAQIATILADTEAQIARAQAQEQAAALAKDRAERLVREGLAGAKLLEEAQAQYESAKAASKAAHTQQQSLTSGSRTSLLNAPRIVAPFDGTVRELRVAIGQQVQIGAPLVEIASRDPQWLRVSVSASTIADIAVENEALVHELGRTIDDKSIIAHPITPAPELAQPNSGTVDLYYALEGSARFRLGQRVAAWLPHKSTREAVSIPASAVLYGTQGETWVYEHTGPQTYARRAIELLRIEGTLALLRPKLLPANALTVGAQVASSGALELFGAELGVAK